LPEEGVDPLTSIVEEAILEYMQPSVRDPDIAPPPSDVGWAR